jgi:hypothetical protein
MTCGGEVCDPAKHGKSLSDRLAPPGCQHGHDVTHLTIIKRETDPPEVIPFTSIEDATAYYARASEQWSESYLVAVIYGPGRVAP